MAFNRPGNSRDDKSNRSSNRAPKAGNGPKKSFSSGRNSSPNSDQSGSRPSKKFTGEKRSFSSSSDRPYSGRAASDGERPKKRFGDAPSGDKKSFAPKSRPYGGKPADGESRPYGSRPSGGEGRPYGTRSSGGEGRPRTSRPSNGEGRASASRPSNAEGRPRKNFSSDAPADRKPFGARGKSSGSYNADERPQRTYSGDKKFKSSTTSGGYKRSGDKPYVPGRPPRANYDDIEPAYEAPKELRGRKKSKEKEESGLIRLNRYISNAGICSRRKADELIAAGVVSVNGEVVSELGFKVDPSKDIIKYNGETLKREKMVYVLLNKPKDYITTTDDPQERRTVMHLVEKASKERIYPVGRLDRNTTGLLLMTNDGDLADKLSHPRNNIVKLYQVELNKSLTQGDMNKIGFGLELEDGFIKPDSISYVAGGSKREVGIQIHSGKNRIVRRIFEHLGYEVVKLDRSVYANLTKKDLPRGRWRFLEEKELIQLKHLV